MEGEKGPKEIGRRTLSESKQENFEKKGLVAINCKMSQKSQVRRGC